MATLCSSRPPTRIQRAPNLSTRKPIGVSKALPDSAAAVISSQLYVRQSTFQEGR